MDRTELIMFVTINIAVLLLILCMLHNISATNENTKQANELLKKILEKLCDDNRR